MDKRDKFQKTLCDCNTVSIQIRGGRLKLSVGELSNHPFENVMLKLIIDSLAKQFDVKPDVLLNPPETVFEFLQKFIDTYGPVFIALDCIGSAFESNKLDNCQKREMFELFYTEWFTLKNLLFVLLGRGSVLGSVRYRPVGVSNPTYQYKRSDFRLLRPDEIAGKIRKTLVSEGKEMTGQQKLKLDEVRESEATNILFGKTSGHPRRVLIALIHCSSLIEILLYEEPINFPHNFYKRLLYNTGSKESVHLWVRKRILI